MIKKIKPYLVIAGVAIVVIALVARVEVLKKIVFGA